MSATEPNEANGLTSAPLTDLVQVEDPRFYDEGQFAVYDRLRTEEPAFHYEPLDVHLLTRLDDVRAVSTRPEIFSNTGGLTLNQLRLARNGSAAAFERFNEPDGELVITKDPPRQRQLRALMAPSLTPRYLDGFRARLGEFSRQLLDDIEPGTPFDFVAAVASRLPLYAAAALLGVDEVDIPRMQTWVDALEELTRIENADQLEEPGQRFDELKAFLREQIERRTKEPGEDMISLILRGRLDDGPVPAAVVLAHVSTLMSNGGTTRLLLASLAGLLADHPEQAAAIRADPTRIDPAIEECLRIAPPARGFVRTLRTDAEVAGTPLRAGDRLYMLYPAANRDPAYFLDPDRFDITRPQIANHAAFGFGAHFCLGAGLARLEARVLFAQLLARFGEIRAEGPRPRYQHVQLNGWSTLPISLHR